MKYWETFRVVDTTKRFDNFVSIETNINAKEKAAFFSSPSSKNKFLYIASTPGNGASHLAQATLNECNYASENYIFLNYIDYLSLKTDVERELFFNKIIDCISVILIDNFFISKNQVDERRMFNELNKCKAKVIITGSHENKLEFNHVRIDLVKIQSPLERKLIIQNLLNTQSYNLSDSEIEKFASVAFDSIRELEGMLCTLITIQKLGDAKRIISN